MSLCTFRNMAIDEQFTIHFYGFKIEIICRSENLRIVHILNECVHLFLDRIRRNADNPTIIFGSKNNVTTSAIKKRTY